MKRYLAVTFACVALLTGCEPKLLWHDTTSQNRPEAESNRALKECEAKNIPPDYDPGHPDPNNRWEPIWAAIKVCMADQGWEPISPGKSN